MTIIVQLSDTHFGTEVHEVLSALERSLIDINPDITLISGDITQRARPLQFKEAAEFFNKLPGKIKCTVPGNHDIPLFNLPLRLLLPYKNYETEFRREGICFHGNTAIVALDATSRWRHTKGRLPEKDIIRNIELARKQMKPNGILIVCAHQPLDVAWPNDKHNIIADAERIAEIFAENGVDVVLSGHVHVPIIATSEVSYKNIKRHFILSGAGTATSYRTRPTAPNSFNIIETTMGTIGNLISVTLMEYQSQTQQFIKGTRKVFEMNNTGWKIV